MRYGDYVLDLLLLAAGMLIFERAIFFQVSILLSISGRSRFSREEMERMFPSQFAFSTRMVLFIIYLGCGMALLHWKEQGPALAGTIFSVSAVAVIAWDLIHFRKNMGR